MTGSFTNGYALREDGTVWAWGSNNLNGLGNGKSYGSNPAPGRVERCRWLAYCSPHAGLGARLRATLG